MLQFTGRESQYCVSAVGGFTDGVARKEGGMAAGLLRQWPLLLLALLATAMITESVNAGVINLNSALPSGGDVSSSRLHFSPDGSRVLYRADQDTDQVFELDNGPEFAAKAVREWLKRVGVKTLFIEPGSPWENGYVESFNGELADELLEREVFYTLAEAKVLIERWRVQYNTIRPHSSLGYRPPAPEAILPAEGVLRYAPHASAAQRERASTNIGNGMNRGGRSPFNMPYMRPQ